MLLELPYRLAERASDSTKKKNGPSIEISLPESRTRSKYPNPSGKTKWKRKNLKGIMRCDDPAAAGSSLTALLASLKRRNDARHLRISRRFFDHRTFYRTASLTVLAWVMTRIDGSNRARQQYRRANRASYICSSTHLLCFLLSTHFKFTPKPHAEAPVIIGRKYIFVSSRKRCATLR